MGILFGISDIRVLQPSFLFSKVFCISIAIVIGSLRQELAYNNLLSAQQGPGQGPTKLIVYPVHANIYDNRTLLNFFRNQRHPYAPLPQQECPPQLPIH